MHSHDLPLDCRFFSTDYHQGRQKFLSICRANELEVHSFIHPTHKDPHGQDLALDVTWIGQKNASKVLTIICGTHGLEAAAGAATIAQFLQNGTFKSLPNDIAILIIHAVNPYGWAYNHRGNEDGVDLNRNCLNHEHPYLANPAYNDLHSLIKTASVDPAGLTHFTDAFYKYGKQHSLNAAINGITAGQYKHADGISFGGHALTWSCQTLMDITEHWLGQAQKIIMIDWHTGIGEYGKPFFIMEDLPTSREYALANSWWLPHIIHTNDILEGEAPNYQGLLVEGLKVKIKDINGADIVGLVIEWGTYDMHEMLQALLMDNWLQDQRDEDSPFIDTIRQQLVDRFIPSSQNWKQSVLTQSEPIYTMALDGLRNW